MRKKHQRLEKLQTVQNANGALKKRIERVRIGGVGVGGRGPWALLGYFDHKLRPEQEPAATFCQDRRSHLGGHSATLAGTGDGEPGFLVSISSTPTIPRGPRDGVGDTGGQERKRKRTRRPHIPFSLLGSISGRARPAAEEPAGPPKLKSCPDAPSLHCSRLQWLGIHTEQCPPARG